MKWAIEKLSPAVEYARLDEESSVWYVPFLQFFAAGEETNQFLALAFPADDENSEIEGIEIRYVIISPFTTGEVHHHRLRPFVKRAVMRNLGLYSEALSSALWFLEHWDEPVCLVWNRVRSVVSGWKFQS